jgi:hypothetical protein
MRLKRKATDPYISTLGTGFTFGVMCFATIGLTVHFWNATWMLWGVLLGIRASIKESQIMSQIAGFPTAEFLDDAATLTAAHSRLAVPRQRRRKWRRLRSNLMRRRRWGQQESLVRALY